MGLMTLQEYTRKISESEEERHRIALKALDNRQRMLEREKKETGKEIGPDVAKLRADQLAEEAEYGQNKNQIWVRYNQQAMAQQHGFDLQEIEAAKNKALLLNAQAAQQIRERVSLHRMGVEEERMAILASEIERYEIERRSLTQRLELAKQEPIKRKLEIQQLNTQLEQLRMQHRTRLESIDAAADAKALAKQQALFNLEQSIEQRKSDEEYRRTQITINHQVAMQQIGSARRYREEQAALNKWYQEQLAILKRMEAETARVYGMDSIQYQQMLERRRQLDQRYGEMKTQAAQQQQVKEKQLLDRATDMYNQHFMTWVRGEQTFSQAMTNMWNEMASNFIQNSMKMLQQMLINLIMHKSVAKGEIMANASQAASTTYKEVAKIPYVGWILAPAAAAAAFAGTMAFGSFARGGVASDDMVGMMHKKEMVLDPSLSTGLQNMIRNGERGNTSTNSQSVSVDNRNSTYVGPKRWMQQQLKQQERTIADLVKQAQRGNMLPSW
jgi:hypothetical protein